MLQQEVVQLGSNWFEPKHQVFDNEYYTYDVRRTAHGTELLRMSFVTAQTYLTCTTHIHSLYSYSAERTSSI